MAVFTAIASVITGAITGAGFSAAFAAATAGTLTGLGIATSLLAGGLAIATAKALGPSIPNIQAQKDPGVKVQLDPSTDNKLPVYYGHSFLGGIAIDAMIKNQNNTMVYAFAIGEQTDSGAVTIGDIYRGDAKLNFGTGANAHQVVSLTDPNGTSVTNVNGKMRCRVYAGNTYANAQIFPVPGGSTVAVDADTMFSDWASDPNKVGNNTIISIFEVDYDAGNGLQGLGTISYEFENSLKNPANVLLDYLKNDRYGCGLTDDDLDLASFDDLYAEANTQVVYTNSSGVGSTHSKWEINGGLSTFQPCLTNIDQICQNSATFFTYNARTGKFKVVPNRAFTGAELASPFFFNDRNIISSIKITDPELYSTYNGIDAEYSMKEAKDQTDSILVQVNSTASIGSFPTFDKFTNEPDNILQTRYYLTNDKARATNLANIDLKQGRVARVLEFEADHTALTVDVGDFVSVDSPKFGINGSDANSGYYRVIRVTEQDNGNGDVTVKVVLMYYNVNVYDHSNVQVDGPMGVSNIPTIPVIALPIPGAFNGDYGNISLNESVFGNVFINEHMKTFGAGTQLAENPNNVPLANALDSFDNPPANILLSEETFDIVGINQGDYELTAVAQPAGTATGSSYDYGFRANADVVWSNATATHTESISTSMEFNNIPDGNPPTSISLAKKMNLTLAEAVSNGAASDMSPANATIRLEGYNNLNNTPATRQMSNLGFQFLRVTKGEK